MNNSTYRFTLDLQKHNSQMSIAVYKRDNAVRLYISLTDGGKPYIIEDGSYAVFCGKRADGEPLTHNCMIGNNTEIIYDFKDSTSLVEGIVNCQLRLYGVDNQLITAPRFIIVVEERVVTDEDIGIDEDTKSALDEIFLAENRRIAAERDRVNAESARVLAENARVLAEEERASEFEKMTESVSLIPPVTSEDEGKFLRVEGEKWAAVEIPYAEGEEY